MAMSRPYRTQSLGIEQIPQALALIQLFDRSATLERWSDCAAFYLRQDVKAEKRDIISLESSNGYIYGLAFCWLKPDLLGGRTLAVENFMSAELYGGQRAASALLKAAERRARAWKCERICFSLIDPPDGNAGARAGRPLSEPFLSSGYTEDRQHFYRALTED